MTTLDPEETPRDPDTGLPQQPATDDDPIGDEVADGDVLSDPDLALDEPPRGTDDE